MVGLRPIFNRYHSKALAAAAQCDYTRTDRCYHSKQSLLLVILLKLKKWTGPLDTDRKWAKKACCEVNLVYFFLFCECSVCVNNSQVKIDSIDFRSMSQNE